MNHRARHAKVSDWIEEEFGEAGPCIKTVVKYIKSGDLPGFRLGRDWFINRLEFEKQLQKSHNPLVNMVLKGK